MVTKKESYLTIIFHMYLYNVNFFLHERKEWIYDYLLIGILLVNNIVTIPFSFSDVQANGESITFQTEYPPPMGSNIPVRPFGPGCDNLYCSEKLLQFIKATNVRFHFYNHTLVTIAQHRYYGLERILVAGR